MSKASSAGASSGNMPWEKHLLLSPEGTLAASSPSLWMLGAKSVGCCARREYGCPSFLIRKGGCAGEVVLHKLASSEAEARVEKMTKVRPGFCLDLLCRIVLMALV